VKILLSSHILEEMHRFATKIGIIHEGTLIDEMDMETLISVVTLLACFFVPLMGALFMMILKYPQKA